MIRIDLPLPAAAMDHMCWRTCCNISQPLQTHLHVRSRVWCSDALAAINAGPRRAPLHPACAGPEPLLLRPLPALHLGRPQVQCRPPHQLKEHWVVKQWQRPAKGRALETAVVHVPTQPAVRHCNAPGDGVQQSRGVAVAAAPTALSAPPPSPRGFYCLLAGHHQRRVLHAALMPGRQRGQRAQPALLLRCPHRPHAGQLG